MHLYKEPKECKSIFGSNSMLPNVSYCQLQAITPSKTMTSTAIIEMGDAWDLGFTDELWNNTT
jgi:hypothetical protein